jgi:hypothetical protein
MRERAFLRWADSTDEYLDGAYKTHPDGFDEWPGDGPAFAGFSSGLES